MNICTRLGPWTAAGISALMLCGCSSTKPSHLYVLFTPEDLAWSDTQDTVVVEHPLAVGPIQMPAQLERPLLLTQSTNAELSFSEYHRWASSLDRQLAQVVIANLSRLLDAPAVLRYPGPETGQPFYRVVIRIESMTGRLGESASLDARWLILWQETETPVTVRSTSLRRDLPNAGHEAYVNAQSRMLADLCREIAMALGEAGPRESDPAL